MGLEKLEEQLENLQMVRYRMDAEGFHYCFKHYSSFKEVEDEKFHELRKQYLKIANDLEQYVHNKINELEDEVNNHYSNGEE